MDLEALVKGTLALILFLGLLHLPVVALDVLAKQMEATAVPVVVVAVVLRINPDEEYWDKDIPVVLVDQELDLLRAAEVGQDLAALTALERVPLEAAVPVWPLTYQAPELHTQVVAVLEHICVEHLA